MHPCWPQIMCHVIMFNVFRDSPLVEDGHTRMVPAVSQFHIRTVVHLSGGGGGGGRGRKGSEERRCRG